MRTPETKEVVTHWEVFFRKSLSKVTCEKKLARIEDVLIVKVYFERRKIAKVFMTHVQGFVRKSLSKATFERKLSIVSLSLQQMKKRKLLTDVTLRRYFWFACFRHRNAMCANVYNVADTQTISMRDASVSFAFRSSVNCRSGIWWST